MAQPLLFVLSHSPRQGALATEALDAVMTAVLLGMETDVVFVNNGVDLLRNKQTRQQLAQIATMGYCHFHVDAGTPPQWEQLLITIKNEPLKITQGNLRALFDRHSRILSF